LSAAPAGGGHPPTIFFLSDYGLADEFVGVVHAVLHRHAPGAAVIDLTHGVRPFDVRAGAQTLRRAVPHLGPGVVLAVVDPGVGTVRRGVAVRAADGRWFVAPDNGLAVPAAERSGGVARALSLRRPDGVPDTFDGRDVFAPAAAALALGRDPGTLGEELASARLVRLPAPLAESGAEGGRRLLRTEVTWVDRFGNVQLATPAAESPPPGTTVEVRAGEPAARAPLRARRVRAFHDLGPGELGLLSDANGQLALALSEGSAAGATGLVEGAVVELRW
jgi:S-adenosylmethionine hydrolase